MAIGTATLTETAHNGRIKKIKWAWASTADNEGATKATAYMYEGILQLVDFVPGTAGAQPTNAYDITITDSDGVDVLGGLGANLSNAADVIKSHADGLGAVVNSALTLNVANAGNSKSGTVYLYIA